MTGQFGTKHLGHLDEHLPTAHGFHEFLGSLHHLNAEDEHEDHFRNPDMRRKYGTRGVIHTWANPDGRVEHDAHVAQLLDALKELGLDQNTGVMYSTDNGAEKFTWPDGGTSPFRGEKNTTY